MPWFWQAEPSTRSLTDAPSLGRERKDDAESSTSDSPDTTSSSAFNATPKTSDATSGPFIGLLSPTTVASTALLTTLILTARSLYKTHARRIPTTSHLSPRHLAPTPGTLPPRSLLGQTTSVHDPDNLRFFHTPLGRLGLWGTFARPVPTARKDLKDATLSVRIAGIDAPELPHFGKPGQPYGDEALTELRALVEGKRVRIWPIRRDQYERVVAVVFVRRRWLGTEWGAGNGWIAGVRDEGFGAFWRLDVGGEMLRRGAAGVYEGKVGAEFGGKIREARYRRLEGEAKRNGLGMWKRSKNSKGGQGGNQGMLSGLLEWLGWKGEEKKLTSIETPREFKQRMKQMDDSSSTSGKR